MEAYNGAIVKQRIKPSWSVVSSQDLIRRVCRFQFNALESDSHWGLCRNMMCSWCFAIKEWSLIHLLHILVTEFNSSAVIPAIIHIQNMILLTSHAWTETQFKLKLILNNRRLFVLTAFGYVCRSKISGFIRRTVEILFILSWCFTFSFLNVVSLIW